MTPRQVRVLKESWARVAPNFDHLAAMFYSRLFELDPTIRPLFPNDMKAQERKFADLLSVIVHGWEYLDDLLPALIDLGRRHRSYRVTDRMYGTVGKSLLWSLKQELGDGFTVEVEEAWAETFNTLAEVMKSAAYATV